MKQFIVLMATIPLMLGLLMQIGLAQQNFIKVMRVEQIVEDHRWAASENGGFTQQMGYELTHDISKAAGIPESSINLLLDTPYAAGSGPIHYRIELYGFRIVAANRLFGIKDGENHGCYVIDGFVQIRSTEEDKNGVANADEHG